MSSSLFKRFAPFIVRFVYLFEPLSTPFISYFVKRTLSRWKNSGLIEEYRTATSRIGRFHYAVNLDIDLTSEHTRRIIREVYDWINEQLDYLREVT